MVAALNITDQRYGRLVAIRREGSRNGRITWSFKCDCGNMTVHRVETVRQGFAKSCGCLRADTTRARSITHGHSVKRSPSRTLRAYAHAKSRCFNPNDAKYPHYGGRGITMCAEWVNDFAAFLHDMGECPPRKTIDRVDVNGHYEPRNCRWATSMQQARTRTDNVLVEHGGVTMVLKDFAVAMGVSYTALHARVKYKGQTPHEAAAALAA